MDCVESNDLTFGTSQPRMKTHEFQAMLDFYFFDEHHLTSNSSGNSSDGSVSSPRTDSPMDMEEEKEVFTSKRRSKCKKRSNRFSSVKNVTDVEKIRRRNRIAQKKSREKKKRLLNERNRKMKHLEMENHQLKEENAKLKLEIQKLRGDKSLPSFTAFAVVFGLILFGKAGIFSPPQQPSALSSNSNTFFHHSHTHHHYVHESSFMSSSINEKGEKGLFSKSFFNFYSKIC